MTKPPAKTTTKSPDWAAVATYIVAKAAGYTYLGFALYLSFSHIIALFTSWGSHQPWVAPLLIDSLILIGKLIRSHRLPRRTQNVGLGLQIIGALFSLAANILAGDNRGDKIIGIMVIGGFLLVEWVVEQVKPAGSDTAATRQAARKAAAVQAAATRKANQAAKAAEQARRDQAAADRRESRRLAREIAQLENATAADFAPAVNAPVSPAPYGRTEPGYL